MVSAGSSQPRFSLTHVGCVNAWRTWVAEIAFSGFSSVLASKTNQISSPSRQGAVRRRGVGAPHRLEAQQLAERFEAELEHRSSLPRPSRVGYHRVNVERLAVLTLRTGRSHSGRRGGVRTRRSVPLK